MKEKITANQFFILFFLCSVYYLSSVSSQALKDNFSDSILSAGIAAATSFLLSLPLLILYERNPGLNPVAALRQRLGGFGQAIVALYFLYFLWSDVALLGLTQNLMTSTIFPTVPPVFIGLMAVAVGVYGACKRIESVARTALFVFVVFLLGTAALLAGAAPEFRFENRQVLLYDGPGDMWSNSLLIFARSSFMPQMVFLLSFVKGRLVPKAAYWHLAVGGAAAFFFAFVVHALGEFATIQLFPLYSLSSISQIPPFQRLDVVFTAMWIMTLSIRLSCDFLCLRICLKTAFSRKYGGLALSVIGGVILLTAFFLTENQPVQRLINASAPAAVFAVALGAGVPLVLLFTGRKKGRETTQGPSPEIRRQD